MPTGGRGRRVGQRVRQSRGTGRLVSARVKTPVFVRAPDTGHLYDGIEVVSSLFVEVTLPEGQRREAVHVGVGQFGGRAEVLLDAHIVRTLRESCRTTSSREPGSFLGPPDTDQELVKHLVSHRLSGRDIGALLIEHAMLVAHQLSPLAQTALLYPVELADSRSLVP